MLPAWLTDTITTDLDRALHYTLLWGLEGVELRLVGSSGNRVPFVNESKLKRRLAESEIPPVAIVPGCFEGPAIERASWLNEIAVFDETLQFCNRIGCSRVVVSGFSSVEEASPDGAAEALRRAGKLAEKRGVTLAVVNEHGMARSTGMALADLLDAVDHPSVRAAWSPVDALQSGENPEAGLRALESRIEIVRCKDGKLEGEFWQTMPIGEGSVDWKQQIRMLHASGFNGPLSLEILLEPRPKHGLRDATTLIQLIRTAAA